jgi:plasmid stabilization system protein ParE
VEALSPSVVITPAAQDDLADAIEWYESHHPGLSFDFLLALDAALGLITRHPDACALIAPGLRRGLLHRFPHAVYYRHRPAVIEVIAILHPSRSPRVWKARNH